VSATAAQPVAKSGTSARPASGSQRSLTAKATISISPIQKPGMA